MPHETSIPENPDNGNRIADKLPPEGVRVKVVLRHLAAWLVVTHYNRMWILEIDGSEHEMHPDDEWRPCNVEKD